MSPGAEPRTAVDDYNLATGWEIRFVNRPGDPRAAIEARDAGCKPRAPARARKASFCATPASRKIALGQGRNEVAAWALSSGENLRMPLRDPVQTTYVDPARRSRIVAAASRSAG